MTDQMEEPSSRKDRKGIQSIATGFKIIDFLIKTGRPIPLKDIAAGTGLSASKLHFYLVSLLEVGIVHQDERSGFYGLGPYSLKLGIAGLEQFDIFAAARDRLVDLATDLGHSVFLGVWGNHGPTIVYRADGSYSRSIFELRVGSVLPILRSALGRLFLAYLPEGLTSMLLESELADLARTAVYDRTEVPRNKIEVRNLCEEIRSHQLSRCRSGLLSDYTAISAPVFDHTGTIIAAITVMGQHGVLNDSYDSASATALSRIANEISSDAGQRTTSYLPYINHG